MDLSIVDTLIELTHRDNDNVKIAAIIALGDYKATIEQQGAMTRILDLCKDPNKDIALSAISALSKLSSYF